MYALRLSRKHVVNQIKWFCYWYCDIDTSHTEITLFGIFTLHIVCMKVYCLITGAYAPVTAMVKGIRLSTRWYCDRNSNILADST